MHKFYNDGHQIKHPVIEVLEERYFQENNTRSLHLRMMYLQLLQHYTVLRVN